MSGYLHVLLLLIYFTYVTTKPMAGNFSQNHGDSAVVNMEVNQEEADVVVQQRSNVNKVAEDVTDSPQDDQEPGGINDSDPDGDKNEVIDHPAVHENDGSVVDSGKLNENSHVSDTEPTNEQPVHIPRDEKKEDIDWGHGEVKEKWVANHDLSALQQQELLQQQQQQQQQPEQKQQHQQENKQEQEQQPQEQQKEQSEQQQQQPQNEEQQQRQNEDDQPPEHHQQQQQEQEKNEQTGQETGDAHDDVGVVDAEHLMHGDSDHGDHHAARENVASAEEMKAKSDHQAQLKVESEQKELHEIQPQIMPNVHNGQARQAAEFMKHRQFGPDQAEEALHAGHHVHEEKPSGAHREDQAGDAELIAHGGDGGHHESEHEKEQKPLTLDPDEMMHDSQGQDHVHSSNLEHSRRKGDALPGADTPQAQGAGEHDQHGSHRDQIGPEFEGVIHDGKHVHVDMPGAHKPRNKVKYQDIIDLGLDQELLKGIDLSKLLEQEKKEMEDWHRETEEREGENVPDRNESERSALFWQRQVTELRKRYLEKLYAKVKHISAPDLDTAEWENDEGQVKGQESLSKLHEGESIVEHEMEMWASTIAKGDRKPYKVMMDMRRQSEDSLKKENKEEEDKKEVRRETDDDDQKEEDGVVVEVVEEEINGNDGEVVIGEIKQKDDVQTHDVEAENRSGHDL